MVRATRSTLLAVVASLIALVGCSDGDSPKFTSPTASTDQNAIRAGDGRGRLDHQLRMLLFEKSGGRGIEFFRFPNPNQLARIPQDPNNPLTPSKVRLGRFLYHETALGIDNVRPEGEETYSCAACHHVEGGFAANRPQGIAEGGAGFGVAGEGRTFKPEYSSEGQYPDCQPIRTPTALNSAYQELMLWNGQFGGVGENVGTEHLWTPGTPLESNHLGLHGLETQAHAGLAVHRMGSVDLCRIAHIPLYRAYFRAAFPDDPAPVNRLNAALAIAAYERTLLAHQAPWQRWLKGNKNAMTVAQKRGAMVFFGKGNCVACHTGPALNSMTFYALGMNDLDGTWDPANIRLDPFGGTVPDAVRKGRGGFTGEAADMYTFKIPQLYNLTDSPYFGHGASFATIRAVVEYKNAAVAENPLASNISALFVPLDLTEQEIDDLVVFLEVALHDAQLDRYVPSRLPSGNCFPVNDPLAQIDLGCEPNTRNGHMALGH